MKQLLLEKGQRVRLSQMGHNNFFYPSDRIETLASETGGECVHWAGGGDYTAVKIPACAIYANIDESRNMVVWVERDVIRPA